MTRPGAELRALWRTAGIMTLTPAVLAGLEIELAVGGTRGALASKWTRRWGALSSRLFGVVVDASGPHLEHGRPYPGADAQGRGRVFVMNHRSMLDIFICLAHIEAAFVSRADLAHWPIIGVAARRVGTLFVERGNRTSAPAAVSAMTAALREGRGILVYAEGTTYVGDDVHPFRSGAFRATAASGAEIVPFGIAYETEAACYGDEHFVTHYRRIAAQPRVRVALVAGQPMHGDPFDLRSTRERARERVRLLVGQARARLCESAG